MLEIILSPYAFYINENSNKNIVRKKYSETDVGILADFRHLYIFESNKKIDLFNFKDLNDFKNNAFKKLNYESLSNFVNIVEIFEKYFIRLLIYSLLNQKMSSIYVYPNNIEPNFINQIFEHPNFEKFLDRFLNIRLLDTKEYDKYIENYFIIFDPKYVKDIYIEIKKDLLKLISIDKISKYVEIISNGLYIITDKGYYKKIKNKKFINILTKTFINDIKNKPSLIQDLEAINEKYEISNLNKLLNMIKITQNEGVYV